ncbi:MAG: DJ-1/PfpI family protein [Mycoplasma sp.]
MIRIAAIACNETEDIELITCVDLWRRAGFRVDTISLEKKNTIILNSGIKTTCDTMIEKANLEQYNAIYLPGGSGHAKYFIENWPPKNNEGVVKLQKFLLKFNDANKYILALCAAPSVLGKLDILSNKKATCYPGFEKSFKDNYVDAAIYQDQNIITGRSPASVFEFSYKVIEVLESKEKADKVRNEIIDKYEKMKD